MTLTPTQSLTLQVQFNPTATGTAGGQITISSNSSTGGTALVALSGVGTIAVNPQASRQLRVTTGSLCFGSVPLNGDDADVDADVHWDGAGDGELSCDHWYWLRDRRRQFAGDTEPDSVADTSGAVPAGIEWDSQWTDYNLQQLVEREHRGGCSQWFEHRSTEAAVDGKRGKSEFWQRDGEHGDDPVVDADLDWNVSGDSELGCDYWCRLYDRRRQPAGDAEPDAIDDATGAILADCSWNRQRSDYD